MKTWLQKQRASSVLGLAIDDHRIDAVVVRRTNGSAQVARTLAIPLTGPFATSEPAAIAAEIRAELDKAEIRERRCTVCLPASWAMVVSSSVAGIPEEDQAEFLQLEAERVFPYAPEDLIVATTRQQVVGGGLYVTQVGVTAAHVARLEEILKAARLTPVSFSLGLPLWNHAVSADSRDSITLAVERSQVSLMVTAGEGLVALRTLTTVVGDAEGTPRVDADALWRELRITLGQLPAEIRESLARLRILGDGAVADQLGAALQARAGALGLPVERAFRLAPGRLGVSLPAELPAAPQLALATRHLAGKPAELEFLPPRVSAWQNLAGRYSSRKLATAAAVIGGVAAIVILLFLVQQVQLMSLRSQWAGMAPKVRELEDMQFQIKRFKPWFDDSFRSLSILKRLTEVFPEDGSVTAKTVELRDSGGVICSGTARDNAALMATLDRLRAAADVTDVQVDQLRGRSPLQFSFNFHWSSQARPQ